jgi:hypothetical protein
MQHGVLEEFQKSLEDVPKYPAGFHCELWAAG